MFNTEVYFLVLNLRVSLEDRVIIFALVLHFLTEKTTKASFGSTDMPFSFVSDSYSFQTVLSGSV